MKVSVILCGILGLGIAAFLAEPSALAAGLMASDEAIRSLEPAWMVLSGASLLTAASLVRRYVP